MTISASEVADFLKDNPDFLINNPGILAFVHLPAQSAGNVTSLQDRQVQTMRDKVKSLEMKIVEMSRAAVENQSIIDNLLTLQRELLRERSDSRLPDVLVRLIQRLFSVPMVKLVLWGDAGAKAETYKMEGAEELTSQLKPVQGVYCGFADQAPAMQVFSDEAVQPRSVVVMPLKVGADPEVFGCLALGSPDKDRFTPNLEKDFLNSLSETACAALTRLN